MFPILLVSRDVKKIKAYIGEVIKKNAIPGFAVFEFFKDKTSIKIDQIRQIASLLTRGGPKKLIIIHDFETAKLEAQNAFLKTLEEKTESAIFLIITTDESSIVSTIVSRCKVIILKTSEKAVGDSFDESSSLSDVFAKYQNLEKKKDAALKICDDLLATFRSRLRHDSFAAQVLKEILHVRQLIDKNNLNPQMAIDHLILTFASLLH